MTLLEYCKDIERCFQDAGMEQPHLEAKWLVLGALDKDRSFLISDPNYSPTQEEVSRIKEWTERRLKGEPLSRIKGVREFWSLLFSLNEHTLDPRPESETLVEAALKWVKSQKDKPWRVLDLGTGSGCLLISLLHELRNATGVGVDLSQEALKMAKENAQKNAVLDRTTFLQSSWCEKVTGQYDIIVSNPPYIPLIDKPTLQVEVREFDPPLALFGGDDGLEVYRIIAREITRVLAPKGRVFLEIGYGQRKSIENIFEPQDFKICSVTQDLAGIDRVVEVC